MGWRLSPRGARTGRASSRATANAGWNVYEREFLALMRDRQVEVTVPREVISDSVLLCSEATPDRCHRRLVVEYLRAHWGDMEIKHLV